MLLADRVLGSANNNDAIYQMFGAWTGPAREAHYRGTGQLVDVVTVTLNSQGQMTGRYYEEMPRELAERFTVNNFRFIMDLRYGKNFTGPTFDVFSIEDCCISTSGCWTEENWNFFELSGPVSECLSKRMLK